jgi:general secretion pathway protein D
MSIVTHDSSIRIIAMRFGLLILLGGAPISILASEPPSSYEQSRRELLDQVDRSWQRPGPSLAQDDQDRASTEKGRVARKLDEIVLPAVSFTNVDLARAVAMLSAASVEYDRDESGPKGVNIVLLDPARNAPSVSLALRDLPLKRVLDLVTDSVGYQYEVRSDAVLVRPGGEVSALPTEYFPLSRATLIRITGLPGAVPPAKAPSADEATPLAAERSAVRNFLQQAGVNFSGVEGSGLAYDGAGIVVTQTARNLERVRSVLARYRDVRQVEIEAKFMEVQEGALEELGVNWHITRRGIPLIDSQTGAPVLDPNGRQVFTPQEVYDNSGANRTLAQAFNGSQSLNAILINGQPAASTQPPHLPGSPSLGGAAAPLVSFNGVVGEFDVNAVVRALSQKQGTDLLSAPRVTVLSGNTANITVAQEMRYPQSYGEIQSQVGATSGGGNGGSGSAGVTITAGTPQEFATRNIGVELKVTPNVEEDGASISLDLNPKVTDFEGFVEYGGPSLAISSGTSVTVPPGFYQPIFSVREVSTKVTVWDGATLMMGGLTREEVKKVNDKVPVLGSLPLVGRLFKSKGQSSQKRNLLIFVTATLVSPGGGTRAAAAPPNAER